ncbi:MBG domain-containing protein [Pedobacter sp. KLB.chiD]|uniref:MBG domain-containing protein n=1 Tax=Pedobacter sp. KLB.chiD TaxID=3387402 RepID=UPI003999722E
MFTLPISTGTTVSQWSSNFLLRKKLWALLIGLMISLSAMAQTPDANGILYVNINKTNGDGSSWDSPIKQLADALKAAKNNTAIKQIWVAKGTYKPMYSPRDGANFADEGRDNSFLMVGNVKLYGGFNGTEASIFDRPSFTGIGQGTAGTGTILSGDFFNNDEIEANFVGGGTIYYIYENAYHVLLSTSGGAELDGFEITGGNADGTNYITVNGINVSRSNGGGIYSYSSRSSSISLTNSSVTNNTASNNGAGINSHSYSSSSSVSLINSSVKKNKASIGGGGISSSSSTSSSVSLINSSVNNNTAGSDGGGIYSYSYSTSSSVSLTNSSVSNNLVNNKRASNGGGGIYSSSSSSNIINLNSSTLAGNTGTSFIYFNENVFADFNVSNSIVYGNRISTTDAANSTLAGNPVKNIKYSLVQGESNTANGNLTGTSTAYSTANLFANADNCDYTLKAGSAAIGKGNNQLYTDAGGNLGTDKDLASNPRLIGTNIDMGAYESSFSEQSITANNINKTYGDSPFEPGATASSGLTVSYASTNNSIAEAYQDTNDGNKWKINIKKAGKVNITASQAGNSNFFAATPVTFELNVAKAPSTASGSGINTITFSDASFVYDGTAKDLSVANLPTGATVSYVGNGKTNAGTYAVTATVVQPNYEDIVKTANLTIHNASPDANGILYVNINKTDGDGSSWDSPMEQLADALKFANTNNKVSTNKPVTAIYVAKGTYKPLYTPEDRQNFKDSTALVVANKNQRDRAFLMVKDVKLFGGFDPDNNVKAIGDQRILPGKDGSDVGTVLSGDFNNDDVVKMVNDKLNFNNNGENAYHVLISAGDVGSAEINGFGVRGGNADGNQSGIEDGIKVNNLSIPSNNGAGLYDLRSSPLIIQVSFYNNNAFSRGGGIYNLDHSSPTINKSNFFNNNATSLGGGIFNLDNSSITVSESNFYSNTAEYGGGINNLFFSSPHISRSNFYNNSATFGGGIYNNNSSPIVTQSSFYKNIASQGGGIFNRYGSKPTLLNVSITGNTAVTNDGKGGGIYLDATSAGSLINSILYNNTTPDNSNNLNRQEVYSENTGSAPVSIKNSILKDYDASKTLNVLASGVINTDPLFNDPSKNDFTLKSGSPAIGKGSNEAYNLTTGNKLNTDKDLGGNPRLTGANIDMGAYESSVADQSITANNISKTYGDAAFEPGATASSGLTVSYASADNTIAESYQDANDGNKWKIKINKAGKVSIKASQGGNGSIPAATPVTFELTIAPKNINASLNANTIITKTYDGNRQNTIDATSLSFGQNDVVNADDVKLSLIANTVFYNNKNAGKNKTIKLPISSLQLSGTQAGNYILSNTDSLSTSTAEIKPADLTISALNSTKVYDGSPYTGGNAISYSGFVNNENESVLTGTLTYGGAANGAVNVGEYQIEVSGLNSTNYNIKYNTAKLTITKAPNTTSGSGADQITFSDASFVYDGTAKDLSVANLPAGATASYNGNGKTNVGKYDVSVTVSQPNYEDIVKTAKLTISKAPNTTSGSGINTITFSDASFVYDGTAKDLSVANLPAGATASYNGNGKTNVGTYVVTATVVQPNYEDIVKTATLTIRKAEAADANGILYVNINKTDGDGSSWDSPMKQLADALKFANANNKVSTNKPVTAIYVAKGTYKPLYTPEDGQNFKDSTALVAGGKPHRDRAFLMVKDVKLYGGFDPDQGVKGINDKRIFPWEDGTEKGTILSGDFNDDDVVSGSGSTLDFTNNEENAYHVLISAGEVGSAEINGFGVKGAKADINLYIRVNGSIILSHTGAGMYNIKSSPIINQSNFYHNTGAAGGGGMYNENSDPVISQSSMYANSGSYAGGVYNKLSYPKINKSSIYGNKGTYGGGVYNLNSSPVINLSNIYDNYAYYGGGIYSDKSSPTVKQSILYNNIAYYGGAGYHVNSSSPTILNSSISGNIALASSDGYAGGLYFDVNSAGAIVNSILYNNITPNTLNPNREEVYSLNTGTNPVSIQNSIIRDFDASKTLNVKTTNVIVGDPKFTNAAAGDLTLQAGSAAIGKGSNAAYTQAGGQLNADKDLAGNPRLMGANIDMGAYESKFDYRPGLDSLLFVDINVNLNTSNQSGDSWANAIPQLADALVFAKANNELGVNKKITSIYVAKGIYKPLYTPEDGQNFKDSTALADPRDRAFLMVKDVKLYGGFDPDQGIRLMSDKRILPADDGTEKGTILSGDFNNDDVVAGSNNQSPRITNNGENAYHVLIATGNLNTAELNGFSIKGGNATGDPKRAYQVGNAMVKLHMGGGLYNSSPKFSIKQSAFYHNKAKDGAGLFNNNARPLISQTSFHHNEAYSGGAMYNMFFSAPSISLCKFYNNAVDSIGGALRNSNSSPNISQSSFYRNLAGCTGGAIFNAVNTHLTLLQISMNGNEASKSKGRGAAIYYDSTSDGQINNSIVYGNTTPNNVNNPNRQEIYSDNANIKVSVLNSIVKDYDISNTLNLAATAVMNEDPMFSDPSTGNLALKKVSPAIGKGSNEAYTGAGGKITTDLDLAGNPRLIGANIDMGAYESSVPDQAITAGNISKTYGDAPFEPGATASSGLTVSYASANNSIAEAYQDAADGNKWKISVKKVGKVNITASQSGNGNIPAAESVTFELNVAAKLITVGINANTIISKTYDGSRQNTIDATSLSFGQNDVVNADDVKLSLIANTVFYNNKNAGKNKTIKLPLSSLKLSGEQAVNYILANTDSLSISTAEIIPADLTITAKDSTKIYDGIPYTGGNAISYSGFVNNENESVLTGTLTYGGAANGAVNVGEYQIEVSGLTSPDYNIKYNTAKLTINKSASTDPNSGINTITFADGSFSYDGTAKSIFAANLPTGATVTYTGNDQINAGTYTVTATIVQPNYGDIVKTATLTINKSVSADPGSGINTITFADAAFTYDGTAKSIFAANLPTGATVTYAGNGQTNAGTYTVTATITQANYADVVKTATLSINKSASTDPNSGINAITFADGSFSYDGTAKSIFAANLPTGATVTYSGNDQINVGTYTVTATIVQPNYGDIVKTAMLTINKAISTDPGSGINAITFADGSFTYDGTAKSIFAANLPTGATVTYTGNDQINAGTYTVTATIVQPNYGDIVKTAMLTINKTISTDPGSGINAITFADGSFSYDGTAKSIFATNLPTGATVTYTGNDQINAGTYTVTATIVQPNYGDILKTATLTINKSASTDPGSGINTITFADGSFTYDGTAKSIFAANLPTGATVTYAGNDQINAGTYTVTATITQANYGDIVKTATLTINKSASTDPNSGINTITFADGSFSYDGTAKSIFAANLPAGATVTYSGNDQINVGTYTVTATIVQPNYGDIVKTAMLTINKAISTDPGSGINAITFADGSFTYDGTAKSIFAANLPAGATVTYSGNDQINAGTSTVTATITQANYGDIVKTATLTINKSASTDPNSGINTITFADGSFTYDGTAKSIFAANLPAGATVTYSGNDQINAGTSTVTATIVQPNYGDIVKTAMLTINKAISTDPGSGINAITFADGSFTYDGTAKSIFAANLPAGATVTYSGNDQINAGTYTVTATITQANYADVVKTATLTINKAISTNPGSGINAITFADGSFIYDGTAKSIFAANLPAGATVTYSGNDQINAGTYMVTATVSQANYADVVKTAKLSINKSASTDPNSGINAITFADGSFSYDGTAKSIFAANLPAGATVTYAGNDQINAGTYTVTATITQANYADVVKTAILTINKTVSTDPGSGINTITFADGSFSYDGTAKSIFAANLPAGATVTYSGNGQINAGTYTVTATITQANYADVVKTATLTINKTISTDPGSGINTITFADGSFTYDGTAKSIFAANLPAGATVTYTGNGQINAGTYTVTATILQPNYGDIVKTATLTINKTISTDPGSGINAITFADGSFTYDGTAKSIFAANLPAGATVSYAGNDQINAGTYMVTATITQANYADVVKTAILTINKSASTDPGSGINTITFADGSFSYDGTAKSIFAANLPAGATVTYAGNDQINAGVYTVTATVSQPNYADVVKTATLTINKTISTDPNSGINAITFADGSFTYDGTAKSIFAANLPAGATVSYAGNGQINAGTYTVTATIVQPNYGDIVKTAMLTINKAISTDPGSGINAITFADGSFTYDGTAKSIFAANLPAGATVTYAGNDQINVGTYTVTATIVQPNYGDIVKTATLTINKTISTDPGSGINAITFADGSFTYDGTAKSIFAANLPAGATVSYAGNDQINAGTYMVTATITQANYADVVKTAILTINKSASTDPGSGINTITFADGSFSYDGTAKSIFAANLPAGATVTYAGNDQINAGTYTVTATITQANYADVVKTAILTINKTVSTDPGSGINTITFADGSFSYDGTAKSIFAANLPAGATVTYTGNGQINAGTYTVTATITQANYADVVKTATLTINKTISTDPGSGINTITFADGSFSYDGTAKSIFAANLPAGATVTYSGNDQINAGTYMVTATITQANYADVVKTAALTINKSASTDPNSGINAITFADGSFSYDGTAKSIFAANLPAGATVTYSGNGQINAGTYRVTATIVQPNYGDIVKTATLTINKTISTDPGSGINAITFADGSFTYDGTAKSIFAANLPTGATVTYTGNDQINAGTYTVTATITQANYADVVKTATLTINKSASTDPGSGINTITFADGSFTYDGTAKSIFAANLPTGATVTYTGNGQINAGTYTVTATITQANYADVVKTATLTINKSASSDPNSGINTITFADGSFSYDGTAKSIFAANLPMGATVTYAGNSQTNAGTYTVTATITQANYADVVKTATLTINKSASTDPGSGINTITFADGSFTYDGTAKSIFAANLPTGATVTYTGNGQINAGTYTVTATITQANYADVVKTATLTINKTVSTDPGSGINTITFADGSFSYDGTAKSIFAANLPAGATVTYASNGQTNAGTYTVTATITQANYADVVKTATLTINKSASTDPGSGINTITFADGSFTYDGTAKSIFAANLPTGATVTYTGNGQINAGTYTVTATITQANYADVVKTATLTINKSASSDPNSGINTITFADGSFSYDGTAKSIFAANLPTGATVTYAGNSQINAGTYTVTATIVQPNYGDIVKTATLVINKAIVQHEVTYASSLILTKGMPMSDLSPLVKGGTAAKFDITPALPDGLILNTVTGVISGIPTVISPETVYKVSVTFTDNTVVVTTLNLSVVVPNLIYTGKEPIQNVLTPDGNGKNDVWILDFIKSFPNNIVKVSDRTGRLVYQKENYDNSWDGSFHGKPLPEGTYYYIIDLGQGIPKRRGFITILYR